MSASVRLPVEMTVEAFLEWEPGDGRAWQLVDGEPKAMAPTNRSHGAIQTRLGQLLANHLDAAGGRCSVITAPGVIVQLGARDNVRILDLAVTCTPYTEEEAVLSAPVLMVEILSPSNQAETWSNVWAYTTIASVEEILVLRTAEIGAHTLRRNSDTSWPNGFTEVTRGDLVLDSIGFRAPLTDLYRTTRLAGRVG